MSRFPAMPTFCSDFFSKTDHLTNDEQWAYLKLMMKTWVRNCRPLPDDDADLARALGMTLKKWRAIKPRIASFFDLSEGTWRQIRLEEEFQFVEARSEISRRNGALGGRPISNNNNGIENPAGTLVPNLNESPHTHIEEKKKDASHPKRARARSDPDGFIEWYDVYPHKIARADAARAYGAALARASPGEMIEGLRRYIASKPPDISWKHPASWLNKDCWLDEPAQQGMNGHGQRQSPAQKLFAGFAAAAGFDSGIDSPADESLLDGGRSSGDTPGAGRGLDRRSG